MALKSLSKLLITLVLASATLFAQDAPPLPAPDQALTPDQLNDLVAPIALYPDPLLTQVLVASTYPLELVEASQFLQKNPGLTGTALTEAAQHQNWDPSVQALIVFPDVVKLMTQDITWTTNLGNAFLAQQPDIMDAVQRMRLKAQEAGKLASTPQESVVSGNENGQPVIQIVPADPEVIYVPEYDPVWIWGPAVWYPYPHWFWPPRSVIVAGGGFGFWPGIHIGLFFGGGWGGWAGWGWSPAWVNHTVIVNNTFIHRYNFNETSIHDLHGTTVWTHDAGHRQGVPYSAASVRERYQTNLRQNLGPRPMPKAGGFSQPAERMGSRQVPQSPPPARNGTAFGGYEHGSMAQMHADHGYSSLGPSRSMPRPAAPAPRAAPAGGGRGRR